MVDRRRRWYSEARYSSCHDLAIVSHVPPVRQAFRPGGMLAPERAGGIQLSRGLILCDASDQVVEDRFSSLPSRETG